MSWILEMLSEMIIVPRAHFKLNHAFFFFLVVSHRTDWKGKKEREEER